MTIFDYFDKIYIINLPNRIDRRRDMTRELAAAGLPPTPGRVEFFPAIRPDEAAGFPSIGARGCALSHLSVLRGAWREGAARVLILEDDVSFARRFREEQGGIADALDREAWDFVYLGHQLEVGEASPARLVPYPGAISLAHFFGVNGRVLDRLVPFLEALLGRPPGHPDGGAMHVDGAYSTFRTLNPDVTTLVSCPSLGWQRSSRSDIAERPWWDRVPGFRWLAGPARTVKTRLLRPG
jgi:hypothetical protein